MAKRKAKTPKKKARKSNTEVARLIRWMESYDKEWMTRKEWDEANMVLQGYGDYDDYHNLCSTGLERLGWWKKNAKKFTKIKDALLTWTHDQRVDYLEFIDAAMLEDPESVSFDRYSLESNINCLLEGLKLKFDREALGITKSEYEALQSIQSKIMDFVEPAYSWQDADETQLIDMISKGQVDVRPNHNWK